ncbi:MAG: TonB-dependent receptor, partial [Bacteroidales bacterium]|nr:TonB-dependent receptor [Bacteroidales bacterium]
QYFTDIKKNLYFLPAGFIGYHFQPKQYGNQFLLGNITLSASHSVRTPTFTDLYYNTGDIEGNKNLKPEKAYTIELSGNFNLKKELKNEVYFNVNVSVFNRWGSNMIDYIKKEDEVKWHTVNHTTISFTGVEIVSEWLPAHYYYKDFWLKRVALQYCYLYSNKESKGYLSRYVLDHLTQHFTFHLSHAFYRDFGAEYAVTFNKRKGEYTSYRDITTGKPTTYPAYCLLDIRLYYQWQMINFYVEATNILNQRYFDLGDLEQPGISVRAGIKVKFDFSNFSLK